MANDENRVLIEQTSKRYKAIQAWAVLLMLSSLAIAMLPIPLGIEDERSAYMIFLAAGGMAGLSVMLYSLGRFLAWWHHG